MRHYQSLLQSLHFYRWVNRGREKGTLSSWRERRRFTDTHCSYCLVAWPSVSLLQGGFALLEPRSIMGDLALDSWSLVELLSFQNCFPVEQPLGNGKSSIPPAPLWGGHPCCSSDKADGVTQGDRRQWTDGGKEKAILIPAGEREREREREGGRKRVKEALTELHICSMKSFINKTAFYKVRLAQKQNRRCRVSLAMGWS